MKTFASAKPGAPRRGICIFPARPGALLCSTALVALLNLAPRAATAQTITQTQTVEGEGESLTLTDEQIVTAGASVVANNGGSVTLNGGSATTTGGATSLLAGRGGANITANGVDISTSHPFPSGATAHGARANSDSTITINGGTITTQSNDSDGLWSAGDGATINATGVTITTHGVRSTGAEFSGSGPTVYGSGLMTLTDVTIATLGNNSYGVASSQSFAVTPGTPLIGPHEVKVVMNGGSITTSGLRSAGLFANSNTTALLSNVTINTSGTQAVGAEGQYAARITLSDVDITTTGLGAYGLYALGDQNGVPTAIFASDVSVLTQGTFAHGLFAMGLANIQLTDGSVTTQGAAGEGLAAAAAIFSRSFSGSSSLAAGPSTISILNSTLISEQGDGILVSNNGFEVPEPTATLNVTLTGSTLTSNTAAWLHAETGTGQIESTLVPVFADVTVDADASNVTGSAVTNEGSTAHVTLRNDSMWTMTGASNLTNFTLDASTLRYGAATTLNVDNPITLDAGGGTVDTNGFSVTLGDVMQGPGALTKTGDGTLLLTAANTHGGGTNVLGGTLQVAAASTSSTDNLGSGGVFIGGAADTPAADGALLIATDASNGADGNFVFEHVLTGTGLLQASNGGGAFDFAPTATVGTAFAGTAVLSNNTFTLTGDNTLALTNATLRLDSGNVTTVGAIGGGATSASEMIFGLHMNGGTLVFDDHVPADTEASDIILTTGLLDVSGAGTVRVDVSNFENTPRVIPSRVELPLLEHDDGPPLSLLIQATGNRVTGTGGALTLTDLSGDPVGTATVVGIEQNGEEVAQGTYDFRLTTASDRIDPDGLYVSFALTQLNLMETGDNALALTPATGATGLATDLSAKITGIGDLVIDADPQATGTGLVSLSNTLNDYTGTTFVRSGTLRIDADNALGQPAANQHTAELDLAADTTADLNGHTQTIGSFNGGADSTMALNGGALSIEQGGLSAGVWSGAGAVNLLGGTLQAGSANTFSAAAAMNVANANATLNLAGLNQTVASLSNAGSIRFNSTGSGNTFTPTVLAVNGDYTGNGGTLHMSTVLGGDNSLTDQLVVGGDVRGTSMIEVSNAGGAGALTTNGILLVDVGGTSPNNAFALTGTGIGAGTDGDGAYVDANAFRYRLFQGDAGGTPGNTQSWYLRSQSTAETPEPPEPPEPEYRPDTPGLTALPGILAQGNLDLLDNLHRRMGDDLNVMQNDDRLWARVFGSDSVRLRQDNVTAPEARGDHYGFQAGVDLFQNRSDDGKRNDVGLYAAYMKSHFNVSGITNTTQPAAWVSTLRPETTALGAYWTYKRNANTGFYSDLIVQYNWYGGDAQTPDTRTKIDGSGMLGSWEIGYGHPYSEHWSIQPQAQMVAQRNDIDDISIPNSTVNFDDKTSLAGRLGVRLVGDYLTDGGRQWKPYVRANYWHGFGGKQNTVFRNQAGSTLIQTQTGFDSIEVGAGFTVAMTRNVNLYAEADHVFGAGKASRQLSKGIAGSLGIRVMFGRQPAPAPVAAPPPPPPPAVAPPPPPPPAPPPPPQPVRLTLSADMLFDFDSAQLRPAGQDSLAGLVHDLRGMQYEVLIIEGHTDRIGSESYNQGLSERRANAVRDYLTGNGIPASDVRTAGYGETRPVTTTQQCPPSMTRDQLLACLQPDRRVEVEVSGTRVP